MSGIIVSDGYTVIVNNWACQLADGAQPLATSPSATATIALARGSLDWSNYPANASTVEAGRTWPNCAYAFVGGNHIPIVVGDATGRPWLPADPFVKAANLFIAPNDVARTDRNISITYGPSHSITDITTGTVITEGVYSRIPTRYLESTTGWGLLSGLSFPIDAPNFALTTFINTAKTYDLISTYTGPTPLTATITTAPSHGAASITSGVLTYTPTTSYVGSDTIVYRLTDSEGTYVEGTISITVGSAILTIAAPENVSEGNSGTQTLTFVVTKSGANVACSATWTLTGTVDASDFQGGQAFTGTVTFGTSDVTQNIDFILTGDTTSETDETMKVQLSAPSGCTIGTPGSATTLVLNDDTVALGGRFYQPPHGPANTGEIVVWQVGTAWPGNGDWTKYLLIDATNAPTNARISQTAMKYKGVFMRGALFNVVGNDDRIPTGKTVAVSGSGANVIALQFAGDGPAGGAVGDPADGRPFIWLDGVDIDTCWNTGDVMGTQMSSWWGDFMGLGTKSTNQRKWADVYLLRCRVKNGHYFFNATTGAGGLCHSDVMQNDSSQIRSLNVWKCDFNHFGQGFFFGSGNYLLPDDGWYEISNTTFRHPPKTDKIYSTSSTPTWNPIQAVDNSCNPDIIVHTTTQYGSPDTIDVQPGEYFGLLIGPKVYFDYPATASSTVNDSGIGLMSYNVYSPTTKITRNYTTRVMTLGVSDKCVTHSPPFHLWPYIGMTGAGGPFNRAAGWYTRTMSMSLPSTPILDESELGVSLRISTASALMTYLAGSA